MNQEKYCPNCAKDLSKCGGTPCIVGGFHTKIYMNQEKHNKNCNYIKHCEWNKEKCPHNNIESNMTPLHCVDCGELLDTSPKEEIVNDWESEFDKEFCSLDDFNMLRINFFRVSNYSRNEPIRSTGNILRNDLLKFINNLLSSTEKRVAKDCIEICKDYIEEVNGCDDVKIIMNKIKSKYERSIKN